jgi:regulation of enolase protein 1 (concanavalin A-like superfamily)
MSDIVRRGPDGRWLPGTPSPNPKGRLPARWKAEIEEHYYELMCGEVSDEDWLAIVRKAVEQGRDGSSVARKWLSTWLMPSVNQMEILRLTREESSVEIHVTFGDHEKQKEEGVTIDER